MVCETGANLKNFPRSRLFLTGFRNVRSGRRPNELAEFQIAEACKPIKRQILYNNTAFPDNINIKVDNTKEGFTTDLQFTKIYTKATKTKP